jgi:hypothetical protein
MPATSKAQQRFFGMVRAAQKGEMENPSSEVAQAAASMSKSDVKKFAKTKHKGLPEKKGVEKMNEIYSTTSSGRAEKYARDDDEKKKFAKADKRMKFGKFYDKAKQAKTRLRPGEVKKWDPEKKKVCF